jgi:hypothetical protein
VGVLKDLGTCWMRIPCKLASPQGYCIVRSNCRHRELCDSLAHSVLMEVLPRVQVLCMLLAYFKYDMCRNPERKLRLSWWQNSKCQPQVGPMHFVPPHTGK